MFPEKGGSEFNLPGGQMALGDQKLGKNNDFMNFLHLRNFTTFKITHTGY